MSMSGKPRLEANATAHDTDLLALLRDIVDEIKGLRSDLAAVERQRSAPRRLSRADEEALVALFPALAAAVGTRTFSVHELHEHARLPVAPAVALRAALAAVGNPRRIGRLLRRAEGVDVGGYRIVANGHSREGMLLSVTAITRKTRSDG